MAEELTPQNNIQTGETTVPPPPSEAAPPSQPEPPATENLSDSSAEGWNKVTTQLGDNANVGKMISANVVYESYQAFVTEGGEDFAARAFSSEYCVSVSSYKEEELNETLVADESLANILLDRLQAKRFLILAGEPEIGKTMLALHLSCRLRQGSRKPCRETLLVRPLQRRVKLDLQKVAEDIKEFGQRVVIFPQLGESDNTDLFDLFARLRDFELEKIVEALKRSESLLLFTADTSYVKPFKEALKSLDVLHEISPPSKQMLGLGLEKKVARLLSENKVPQEQREAAWNLITGNKEMLVEQLPKMSQLALLVKVYLLDIIDQSNSLDLPTAIDLVESPEKWVLQDLGKDFEAWCFVFTLGLCQSGAETEGVPWSEFEALRGAITKRLSTELRMWRQLQDNSFAKLLEERALLEKCRAQIVREAGVGDLVRFVDGSYPAKLWRVFTTSNRRALTSILPLLRELAQASETQTRARAARIIGRIGEINPSITTLPIIREWIAAKPLRQRAAVGYLYEGILASPDDSYRQICLLKLENLSLSREADELWTAIAVYKQIGQGGGDNLALAVIKLGQIAERNFSEWLGWEKKIERQLEAYLKRKQKDWQELLVTAASVQKLKELREELRQVYDEDGRIMLAICYSLVALSLQVSAFDVIVELNEWIQQGRGSLAALTSWMFWMEEGVADRLAQYRMPAPSTPSVNGATLPGCHPMVVALADAARNDTHAVSRAACFLAATHNQFSGFPIRMRQFLRKKFLLHLKDWVSSAWPVKEYRQLMNDLYLELLRSSHADLASNLTDYLKNDLDFNTKAHLKCFAEMVLRGPQDTRTGGSRLLFNKPAV
jgi:hypothetical protein